MGLKEVFGKIFGTKSDHHLKRLRPLVDAVAAFEPSVKPLSDDELRARTGEFRRRIEAGESLDDLLPEAFATIREVAWRVLHMRHFDVQILGGAVLHEGLIAEMKTGEGKTLVATLPVYLNALSGKGVHVVTVNDYLARRDAEWMGQVYRFMGMDVGTIYADMPEDERKRAYASDVTYGTNNEFGFDYLRDNMKYTVDEQVQAFRNYAIVDEVDSILIDEARTPLIISGEAEQAVDKYVSIDGLVPSLRREMDYVVDEKARVATLTEEGMNQVEARMGVGNLYEPENVELLHHINQALRAHVLYRRDVDYVINDGEVVIVDEFTGRLMPGRRWSDGLHQAIEAKERVKIQGENQTLATITFQNYFKLYSKLAGMTGTAETEAEEFEKIYGLEVAVVPTNRPLVRKDEPDLIFRTVNEKFNAIAEDIAEAHRRGRPVLVGTTSIEKSERLAKSLKAFKIKHHVLNAKHHEREAEIVAQAGQAGAVTIATNMAGRGTDIVLGGNPVNLARREVGEVADEAIFNAAVERHQASCAQAREQILAAGGLHIIGTERHESRRIDNQLRGRAGRQGDPGSTRFFLSVEDDLLRVFGGERVGSVMEAVGLEDGEPIAHRWLSRAVENAQKKLEGQHFGVRKQLTEFDAVMNEQRATVYGIRQEILTSDTGPLINEIIANLVEDIVLDLWPERGDPEPGWEDEVAERCRVLFDHAIEAGTLDGVKSDDTLAERLSDYFQKVYAEKAESFGAARLKVERFLLLQSLDNLWKEHLLEMEQLRDRVGLVGYAQLKPVQVYKKEGFELFQLMLVDRNQAAIERLFRVRLVREPSDDEVMAPRRREITNRGPSAEDRPPEAQRPIVKGPRIGRNDPCPCGSGKKYKRCHLKSDQAVA